MKTLIVVDMQNDFITGPLSTPEALKIVPHVKAKIEEYRYKRENIVFTRDTHYTDYLHTLEGEHLPVPHCIYKTDGWDIKEELLVSECRIKDKESFGALDLDIEIPYDENVESIELVGVCTDICVISNALILKAQYPEVEIYVDANCCAGTTPEMHKAALQVMKSCQINVINEE